MNPRFSASRPGSLLHFLVLLPLLLASCATGKGAVDFGSLDVMYANAYIQGPAERLPPDRLDKKKKELTKAKDLYLKGDRTLSTELERRFPGLGAAIASDAAAPLLGKAVRGDVPLLYWESAALMSAFALDPLDVSLSVRVKEARALMARAYDLDPDYGKGSLDEFYISFYGSLPGYLGGDKARAKFHFDEAIRKSGGGSVSAYVSYAMAICVPAQDYKEWKRLIDAALAVDLGKFPDRKLANGFARKKALWLLSRKDDLFLSTEE